jgi:hypothetical protein
MDVPGDIGQRASREIVCGYDDPSFGETMLGDMGADESGGAGY